MRLIKVDTSEKMADLFTKAFTKALVYHVRSGNPGQLEARPRQHRPHQPGPPGTQDLATPEGVGVVRSQRDESALPTSSEGVFASKSMGRRRL
jgi:hypothetical protein